MQELCRGFFFQWHCGDDCRELVLAAKLGNFLQKPGIRRADADFHRKIVDARRERSLNRRGDNLRVRLRRRRAEDKCAAFRAARRHKAAALISAADDPVRDSKIRQKSDFLVAHRRKDGAENIARLRAYFKLIIRYKCFVHSNPPFPAVK